MTSPQTPEGKQYWDKLYKKAGELFGSENITIPTLTRPWIVPDEVIIRESPEGAYIYKATLKVMLEEDYLEGYQPSAVSSQQSKPNYQLLTSNYTFSDPRLKELNEYSTQLIKETIIPKLTRQINTSKRYAPLRQVYYSLILAQWFKQKYGRQSAVSGLQSAEQNNPYVKLIDSGSLTSNFQPLTSQNPYSKEIYFQQYQKSFKDGEYNLQEPVYTPMGQSIRRYMSGGMQMDCFPAIKAGKISGAGSPVDGLRPIIKKYCLLIGLPFAMFLSAEPSVNAITLNNNGLRLEAVVESEESLEEVVRVACKRLGLNIEDGDIKGYVAILHNQYPAEVKRGDSINIKELVEKMIVEDILKKCEVVSKQLIEVDNIKYKVYFVKSGKDIKYFSSTKGASIGDTIFINLEILKRDVKSALEDRVRNFIPPGTTEAELFNDTLKATLIHELMHILLSKWLKEGLKTSHLDEVLSDWFGEVPSAKSYMMKQELIAHLAQTLSSLYPKSYLASFMAGLISNDHPEWYINIFALIIDEVLNPGADGDPVKRLERLSNVEIMGTVRGMLEKYFRKDIIKILLELQKAVDGLLSAEKKPNNIGNGDAIHSIPTEKAESPIIPDSSGSPATEKIKEYIPPGSSSPMEPPSASLKPVDEEMQRYIDKMAEVIFNPQTNKFVDSLPIEDLSLGITIEKLTGGNRGKPVYKLSTGSESVVVKFFPPKLPDIESDFDIERIGLERGKGLPGFQQLRASKKYPDLNVSYILTEFIPGKSFSAGKWDFWEYQKKQSEYIKKLTPEIEIMPLEHWKQLVLIYLRADENEITLDVSPENFKYHPERGFMVLDYYPRGGGLYFSHYSVEHDVVEIVTGIKEHMLGTDNKLVKFIKKKIFEAQKAVNKEVKTGGIDLSRINKSMRMESVSSPGSGGLDSPVDVDFDLDEELSQLQKLLNAQIIPSADRLKRYAYAARASSFSSPESADSALSLVAETFRLQEENALPASPELKALAAWLEQTG